MVKSGQAWVVGFETASFSTGAAADATVTPTGTLVVNGTDNAATVTVTNKATGSYKASVTLPTLAAGDVVEMRIAATVGGVSGIMTVARDVADTAYVSEVHSRIGAAGAGLTALGDSRLNYLDAAVSSISGAIVAQAVASILSGTELTIVNNASIEVDFTGLGDMTGWDSVYFTIKQSKGLPDADAWLQIKRTLSGTEITRVGKAAPATGTATDGSITITSVGTGALTVAVAPRSALLIPLGKGIYDIAMVEDGVKTILASGDCVVTATATTTYA